MKRIPMPWLPMFMLWLGGVLIGIGVGFSAGRLAAALGPIPCNAAGLEAER